MDENDCTELQHYQNIHNVEAKRLITIYDMKNENRNMQGD